MMRKISKCCCIILPINFDLNGQIKANPECLNYLFLLFFCLVDNQKIEAINDLLI